MRKPKIDKDKKVYIELEIVPSLLLKTYEIDKTQENVFGFINSYNKSGKTLVNYYPIRKDYFDNLSAAENFIRGISDILTRHIKLRQNIDIHLNHLLVFTTYFSEKFMSLVSYSSDIVSYNGLITAYKAIVSSIINVEELKITVKIKNKAEPIKLYFNNNSNGAPDVISNKKSLYQTAFEPNKAHPEQNKALGLMLYQMFNYLKNNKVEFKRILHGDRAVYLFLYDFVKFLGVYEPSKRVSNGIEQVSDDWEKIKWLIEKSLA
ncbi:hypothetical protein MUY27_13900 [Mucilaginibacter sp. RS28]|uniref:Uncharacterized protein n=1 Tax=Mucilaginibacter straminoryzae TaxID=2932774 RepID=A0A9X1X4G6_9SPHI|nr:hypothetical protein [Mucilaginibacter straminoryzae]MCJ8210806.1 hypothetical protein [Mucilaginibacter straminoryzae]